MRVSMETLGGALGLVTPPREPCDALVRGGGGVGSDCRESSPPSSAAALGMETSAPRAGSQVAAKTARHSVSYGAEPPRESSRDEIAEMAVSTQGRDGRARRRRRGEAPSWAAHGEWLHTPAESPGNLKSSGEGRAARLCSGPADPRVRPRSGATLGRTAPACYLLLGSDFWRRPQNPKPRDVPSLFSEGSGTLRLRRLLYHFGRSSQTPGKCLRARRFPWRY